MSVKERGRETQNNNNKKEKTKCGFRCIGHGTSISLIPCTDFRTPGVFSVAVDRSENTFRVIVMIFKKTSKKT